MRVRCVPRIAAGINRRLGRPFRDDELADLAQDILVVVWQKLGTFSGRAQLETWIHRIAYLELMNARRKKTTAPKDWHDGDGPPPEPIDRPTRDDPDGGVLLLLRHLAPREAEVLRLVHVEGIESMTEVALLLGISSSSVKTHYYRGLDKLRQLLRRSGTEVTQP